MNECNTCTKIEKLLNPYGYPCSICNFQCKDDNYYIYCYECHNIDEADRKEFDILKEELKKLQIKLNKIISRNDTK